MLPKQLEALIRRVREVLEAGLVVMVMGWRMNHHTPFTSGLSEKKVRFFTGERPPKDLSDIVGLVLNAKYQPHKHTQRIGDRDKNGRVYAPVIEYRTIVQILEACKDLLEAPVHPATPVPREPHGDTPTPAELSDKVMDFLTTPRERNNEMSPFEKFARAFLEEAATDKEGMVGSRTVGELRERCGVSESAQQLIGMGWISPVARKGTTKKSAYKAGPKIEETASRNNGKEPTDPYELAKFLVAKEPELLAKKAEIDTELARVQTAKEVLKVLESLKKPETPPE